MLLSVPGSRLRLKLPVDGGFIDAAGTWARGDVGSGKHMARIRIVADYCSAGYQLGDDEARRLAVALGAAPGVAPLSEALAERLAAWNACYEDRCHPLDYEDVTGSRFDFVAFSAEGLELARAVKRELPGWTVTYWDEALDWFLARDPRTYDPARAEYEITVQDACASGPRRIVDRR